MACVNEGSAVHDVAHTRGRTTARPLRTPAEAVAAVEGLGLPHGAVAMGHKGAAGAAGTGVKHEWLARVRAGHLPRCDHHQRTLDQHSAHSTRTRARRPAPGRCQPARPGPPCVPSRCCCCWWWRTKAGCCALRSSVMLAWRGRTPPWAVACGACHSNAGPRLKPHRLLERATAIAQVQEASQICSAVAWGPGLREWLACRCSCPFRVVWTRKGCQITTAAQCKQPHPSSW
jgi:hypothetical protein